jgi:hypothetical protein
MPVFAVFGRVAETACMSSYEHFPPRPPVRVWERLADATRRLGIPSTDLLKAEVLSGRKGIRFARVGARELMLLCKEDVDQYARELNEGNTL